MEKGQSNIAHSCVGKGWRARRVRRGWDNSWIVTLGGRVEGHGGEAALESGQMKDVGFSSQQRFKWYNKC